MIIAEHTIFPVPTQYHVYRMTHTYADGRSIVQHHAFEHVSFGSGVIQSRNGASSGKKVEITLLGHVQAQSPALAVVQALQLAALAAEEVA